MNSKNYLVYGALVVGLLGLCLLLWYSTSMTIENRDDSPLDDPLDVLFDFYDSWLDEAQAGGTVKTDSILLSSTAISESVRERLISGLTDDNAEDPALCQVAVPDKIRVKYVSEQPTAVEAMIMSTFASSTPVGFALVKMSIVDRTWVIDSITCSKGDVLEDREFSFEQTGQLLKNVPAPLDSNFWHVVFTDNGTPGYTAPLFFSASSTCVATDGTESVCDTNTFTEAADVKVQGQMSETGVNVARVMFTAE